MTSCQHCLGVPAGSRSTCSCGRGLAWYQPSRALLREACEASCFDGFDGEWYGNQIEDEWFQRAKEVTKDE
jgi:hypothetical protein